jgi:membrane fusion protein (multidrug efflux system)
MAAARDQAARIVRAEPDAAEGGFAREVSADSPRSAVSEETVARRSAESPANPATEKPATGKPPGAPPAADAAAPKSGKRKRIMMGVGALLALAAASYGVHYVLVGRFHVSTDDAYVRANNTTLGARVSGHVAAILPGDNVVVRRGDIIASRLTRRARRSRPSRPPSTGSAARSPRWKARPNRPRRSWFPRRLP